MIITKGTKSIGGEVVDTRSAYIGGRIATHSEMAARIADLEADIADTLRAVLHHFGPDGAHKVTSTVLELKPKR